MSFYGSSGVSTLPRRDLSMFVKKIDVVAAMRGLIGMAVAPVVTVDHDSAKFPVIPRSEILQKMVNNQRQADGKFNRVNWKFTSTSYSTEGYGLEYALDREERKIYSSDIEHETVGAEILELQSAMQYEERVITKMAAATSASTTISTTWDDPSSTPVTDMVDILLELRNKQVDVVQENLKMVLDYEVVQKLRLNSEIKDALATTRDKLPKNLSNALLAEALGVGEICVANSWKNNSSPGIADASASYALQWDKTVGFLCLASATKDPITHRWCNTLKWGGGISGFETYYEPQADCDVLRIRERYGLHVVDANSALKIPGIAA